MKNPLKYITLLSSLVLMNSCGQITAPDQSTVKFSPFAHDPDFLIAKVKQDPMEVCIGIYSSDSGTKQRAIDSIQWSLSQWLTAARSGTTGFVTSQPARIVEGCTPDTDLVVSVGDVVNNSDHSPRPGEEDRSYCAFDGGGIPHCRIYSYATRMTYLHELGHAFGLGDTYREGTWDPKEAQPRSVMWNQYNFTQLEQDDVDGIRFLYCQAFRGECAAENNPNRFLKPGFYAYIAQTGKTWSDFSHDVYRDQTIYRVDSQGRVCAIPNADVARRLGAYGNVRMLWNFDPSAASSAPVTTCQG